LRADSRYCTAIIFHTRNVSRPIIGVILNQETYRDMAWIMLVIAGLFEVGFTTCLSKAKISAGAAQIWWLAGFFICLVLSMVLLYKATQTLPLGTAYAVWTGIGAAGTAIVGMFFFDEPTEMWRVFFLSTLIASIIGLKFVSN
jgi:quaternary ammonium compound-resistance protein SugE